MNSWSAALRHAFRRLRRGWRSGELLVLGLALAVASAAMVSVGMFSGRVQQAIERGSGEALGADAGKGCTPVVPLMIEDGRIFLGLRV